MFDSFHFHNNVLNVTFYTCRRNLVLLTIMIANVTRNFNDAIKIKQRNGDLFPFRN